MSNILQFIQKKMTGRSTESQSGKEKNSDSSTPVTVDADLRREAETFISKKQYQSAASVLSQYLTVAKEDIHAFKNLLTIHLYLNNEHAYAKTLSYFSACHPDNGLLPEGIKKGMKHFPKNNEIKKLSQCPHVYAQQFAHAICDGI